MHLVIRSVCLLVFMQSLLNAQPPVTSKPASEPMKDSGSVEVMQVVIKRDAIHLMNPKDFQASVSLKPVRLLEVRSKLDGVIQNIRVKVGDVVKTQEELIQFESVYTKMLLEQAQAVLKAATLRQEIVSKEVASGKQPQIALDLTEAEINVAKSNLDLAKFAEEGKSIRAAFSGQIQSLVATQGALVNKTDLLLTLADTSQLIAQIPVDREKVKKGDTFDVQLENEKAKGKVQAILPLNEKWEALRQIMDTAAIAVVVIENQNGAYQDGQTVYSSIVPRLPVIEAPNIALKNSETGLRMIQVVRNSMIRDIEVQLLGPVGEGRSYVSGPVQENDELITQSSLALTDGTMIRPAQIPQSSKKQANTTGAGNKPSGRSNASPGF